MREKGRAIAEPCLSFPDGGTENGCSGPSGTDHFHAGVEEFFNPVPVPTAVNVLLLDDEGRIAADAVDQGFIESQRGLSVDQTYADPVSIEPAKLAQPVAQFCHFLFQVGRIIGHVLMVGPGVHAGFVHDQLAGCAVAKCGGPMADHFYSNLHARAGTTKDENGVVAIKGESR